MRIFVDMDGTLCKWNNVEFEQLYEEGYYRNLEPNWDIVNEINSLIDEGENVYILSCYLNDSKYALQEKIEWCKEYLPNLSEDKYIFVPFGESKAKVFDKRKLSPITNHDYLIDDYTKNLLEWKEMGGIGIKYINGINHTKGTWKGLFYNNKSNTYQNLLAERIFSIEKSIDKNKYKPYPFSMINNYGKDILVTEYFKEKYPILSDCDDFYKLLESTDIQFLDDVEYTLFLYNEGIIEVSYGTVFSTYEYECNDENGFIDDEFLDDNIRISEIYIEWYERMIDTDELLKDFGFKEEELDEREY